MADPKVLQILKALSTRLEGITAGAGYYTDIGDRVQRGNHRMPDPPGVAIYLENQSVQDEAPGRALVFATINIEAFAPFEGDHPEDMGCFLLDDIRQAIEEPTDRRLGGLLTANLQDGISYAGGTIIYPETGDNIVGARVTYTAPYIRRSEG